MTFDIFDRAAQRERVLQAWQTNPDQAAETKRISQSTGIPPGMVRDDDRQNFRLSKLGESIAKLSVLPGHIQNTPMFATLAQDDFATLAKIEEKRRVRARVAAADQYENERWKAANISGWEELRDSFFGGIRRRGHANLMTEAVEATRSLNGDTFGYDKRIDDHIARIEKAAEEAGGMANLSLQMQDRYEELTEERNTRRAALQQARAEHLTEYAAEHLSVTQGGIMRDSTAQNLVTMGGLKDWDKTKFFVTHPDVAFHTIADSFGTYSVPLVGGTVSTMVAGPLAGAAVLGGLGYETEYNAVVNEKIEALAREQGAHALTPENLAKILDGADVEAITDYANKRAAPIALMDAISMGLAGRFASTALAAGTPFRGAGKSVLSSAALGAAGEAGAQLLSEGEIKDYGDVAIEGGIELLMGGFEYAGAAVHAAKQRLARNQTHEMNDIIEQVNAAAESRLAERDPEAFYQLMRDVVAESDMPHLYLDGNALHQSGLQQAFLDALPNYADVVQEAQATGGSIQIRTEDLLAGARNHQELIVNLRDYLRTDPDGLSLQEIAEHSEAELRTQILERQRDLAQMDEAERESNEVYQHIHAQLTASGRLSPDAVRNNSILLTSFFQTMGGRMGENMRTLYERLGLRIVGGEYTQQGQALAQPMPDVGAVVAAAKDKIRSLIQSIRSTSSKKQRFTDYMDVDEQAAQEASIYGLDIAGFKHVLDESAVLHVDNRHSNPEIEETRGQIAIQDEDFETIADVVSTPDKRIYGLKTRDGQDIIASVKALGDGTMALVEEVRVGRKKLAVKTLRKHTAATDFDTVVNTLLSNARSDGGHANIRVVDVGDNHNTFYQGAWHGSPHRGIENQGFKLHAIGTGEGAQAYGWGMYFSGDRAVAEGYRDALAGRDGQMAMVGDKLLGDYYTEIAEEADNGAENGYEKAELVERLGMDEYPEDVLAYARDNAFPEDVIAWFETEVLPQYKQAGQIYHLEVPENNVLLDYDAQVHEQPIKVREALQEAFNDIGKQDAWNEILSRPDVTGADVYQYLAMHSHKGGKADHQKASELLLKHGIPGLRYLDGNSRADGEGSHNFVIWDENLLTPEAAQIAAYYQTPQSPRGQYQPETRTITLFENADLSTLPHELGHFYLDMMVLFANELRHIDNIQGGQTLSDSERGVLRDVDTLMDWFGVDLQTWNRMTLEEQRPYHEQFARGFEQYLLEGRAPSLELQSLFARFRAWLLNIYRHAKNLNVPMTDEVRQVFDRMLASDEAIQLAQQNASMRPMFDSAEAAGMDAQDFADYQRAHQDATDTALDEMQARSMRDVRLIRNLTSKRLRALQRESREKRRELQMEARREILSQPVYRAWQMLTARNPSKTAQNKPKWQNAVDSKKDSLFVAMAKLGGINAAQAKSEWGFEDAIRRPHPHHPVVRKEGGMKLDDMATALMELGYLPSQYDLNLFAERFEAEFRGKPQYSVFFEEDLQTQANADYGLFASLRLDRDSLAALGYSPEQIDALGKKAVKSGGVHPDQLADLILDEQGNPVYDSGDALVQDLLQAPPPKDAIDTLTDRMMLERYGELATPEALMEAAQMAVHNDVRLKVLATEANALAKATGNRIITARMARELARQTLAGKRLRDIKPQQYQRMEARAARSAEQARQKGDIATAAAEKRNQVLQAALARAAYEALENAATQVRMLKRMGKLNPKTYAIEYREQIEGILEKYNLREQSGKALERRQTLAQWVGNERAKGNDPNLPAHVLDELQKTPWQELTPEALQGVVDSVKQIAHLGKLKNKLLTRRKNQDMDAVKAELVAGVEAYATQSGIVNRTATDAKGKTRQAIARFFHAHRRAGMIARLFDGDRDGGVWWENIIRPMNDAANWQTATRTQAVKDLQAILQPLMDNKRRKEKIATDLPDLDGKRRSLSVEEVFVMALNWGNAGNKQRLLSGNRWNEATARAQLSRLTAAELNAVQAIWDYFEQFKPLVAALERRTKGTEPDWVEAVPFSVRSADGVEVALRGGYYPVRYDTRASVQAARDAEALDTMREQVGRTAMTTRQSYTKARADEVHDRPLMLDMSGLFTGLNEVIHDLSYREVLMDTQRLLGSKRVSGAVRSHYGDEVYKELTEWVRDIAVGDLQRESALVSMLNKARRYGTFAYLGYNLMSAAAQPLGLLQSAARVGTGRIMAETARYALNPAAIAEKNREANAASVFMADRGSTQMRELNELANSLLVGNTLQNRMLRYSYTWLMTVQKQVDVITWHAARTKALEDGFSAQDAAAIADQAVIDTQGSGMIKDLSKVERDQATRIFTVFYSFMNTILNLEYTSLKAKNSRAKKAEVLALLSLSVPILNALMRSALKPGEDEDKWDEDNWYKTIGREIVNHHLGLFVGLREFQMNGFSYTGPVGLHIIEDYRKLGEQLAQGEADNALRKAIINAVGATTGMPSVAINRVIDGAQALADGETNNPAVMAFGLEK